MDGLHRSGQESVGETAAQLPWICPPSGVLEQLAHEPLNLDQLSFDPGLVLLALRFVRPSSTPETFRFSMLADSVVAEAAARFLETKNRYWLNPSHGRVNSLLLNARRAADAACRHAESLKYPYCDAARATGLLSSLGSLAVASVDPCAITEDDYVISRRLAARWRLPEWLGNTIAYANLPLEDAVRLGADHQLSQIVRLVKSEVETEDVRSTGETAIDPHCERLLPKLLRSAARTRRVVHDHRLRTAERDTDRLHQLLAELRRDFEQAVRDAKLTGLAELAAGAGHEINNPLAIISGHAQRLRKVIVQPEQLKSLDVILKQSTRISDIVRDLMYYARPASPNQMVLNPTDQIRSAIEELEVEARSRNQKINHVHHGDPVHLVCDPSHFQVIIKNLLRNALEASLTDATVEVESRRDGSVIRFHVIDRGPGPTQEAIPHLFDPFFSGRSAGRGRGLGLATAWRLAGMNGGDLRYIDRSDESTIFELTFAIAQSKLSTLKISA